MIYYFRIMISSKLYSIFSTKCPKCLKANVFETKLYNAGFHRMKNKCEKCGEDFQREVGFYYGAMYVSYALTVAYGLIVYAITNLLLNFSIWQFILTFSVLQVILLPLLYRYSRMIWLNFFVHYKKDQ